MILRDIWLLVQRVNQNNCWHFAQRTVSHFCALCPVRASFSPPTQPFPFSYCRWDGTGQKLSPKKRPSWTAPSFSMNLCVGIRGQSFFWVFHRKTIGIFCLYVLVWRGQWRLLDLISEGKSSLHLLKLLLCNEHHAKNLVWSVHISLTSVAVQHCRCFIFWTAAFENVTSTVSSSTSPFTQRDTFHPFHPLTLLSLQSTTICPWTLCDLFPSL